MLCCHYWSSRVRQLTNTLALWLWFEALVIAALLCALAAVTVPWKPYYLRVFACCSSSLTLFLGCWAHSLKGRVGWIELTDEGWQGLQNEGCAAECSMCLSSSDGIASHQRLSQTISVQTMQHMRTSSFSKHIDHVSLAAFSTAIMFCSTLYLAWRFFSHQAGISKLVAAAYLVLALAVSMLPFSTNFHFHLSLPLTLFTATVLFIPWCVNVILGSTVIANP